MSKSNEQKLSAAIKIAEKLGFELDDHNEGVAAYLGFRDESHVDPDRVSPFAAALAKTAKQEITAAIPGVKVSAEAVDEWVSLKLTV